VFLRLMAVYSTCVEKKLRDLFQIAGWILMAFAGLGTGRIHRYFVNRGSLGANASDANILLSLSISKW